MTIFFVYITEFIVKEKQKKIQAKKLEKALDFLPVFGYNSIRSLKERQLNARVAESADAHV